MSLNGSIDAEARAKASEAKSVAEYALQVAQEKGTGDKTYVHTQGSAESEWTITHNLSKFPSVTVYDNGGTSDTDPDRQVIGDIEYINENSLKIYFSSAFGGKAFLN